LGFASSLNGYPERERVLVYDGIEINDLLVFYPYLLS
jgi:hypothetical protein